MRYKNSSSQGKTIETDSQPIRLLFRKMRTCFFCYLGAVNGQSVVRLKQRIAEKVMNERGNGLMRVLEVEA